MHYDERLEDLLLSKDFEALLPAERDLALAALGSADAYASARLLRLRSRELLRGESGPADPEGLARLMGSLPSRPRRLVPLWQAAAAVALVALAAWMARGWFAPDQVLEDGRLAVVDTVLKEVRVVDTVYLPASPPDAQTRPRDLADAPRPPRKKTPPANTAPTEPMSPELRQTVAALPSPDVAAKTPGMNPGPGYRPEDMRSVSDKWLGGL